MANLIQHEPWEPTCWVGGVFLSGKNVRDPWIMWPHQQLEFLRDDCRAKYAAVKATAAIMRAKRK